MKMPGNEHKPVLYIDVDGVISLYGWDSAADRPPGVFVTVDGIPHYLSSATGELLRALAQPFELVWCTGWQERADYYLPHALGLETKPAHLALADAGMASKRAAIDAHAGGRPIAWIDDSHSAACRAWAEARAAPTLLVTTDPPAGMTAKEAAHLKRWAASLSPGVGSGDAAGA